MASILRKPVYFGPEQKDQPNAAPASECLGLWFLGTVSELLNPGKSLWWPPGGVPVDGEARVGVGRNSLSKIPTWMLRIQTQGLNCQRFRELNTHKWCCPHSLLCVIKSHWVPRGKLPSVRLPSSSITAAEDPCLVRNGA